MSHLLIRAFYRAQASRGFSCRLSSTNVVARSWSAPAPEPNDLKTGDPIHAFRELDFNQLKSSIKLCKLEDTLADSILLTKNHVEPSEVEPSDTKPPAEGDKVLSARDVLDKEDKASLDQLNSVADRLTRLLPRFFSTPHHFDMYSKNVVFIDRIRAIRTQGLGAYTIQVAMIKAYYLLNYTSNKLELLNLVKDPEESCVKIRWRVVSKPGLLRFMLAFYKYHGTEIWKDAISTMYVNKEGKIYCHICDNIDVEKDEAKVKKIVKSPLVNRGVHV